MNRPSLTDIARGFTSDDPVTKPLFYYEKYESYFQKNDVVPATILEIGVYKGESTKVFSKAYPDAKIVGLDLNLQNIDFSGYRNVKYLQADQTNRAQLEAIIRAEFPDGIDLVIEDASHIGAFSRITFDAVFPFVKPRGVYIVEDWGTGYWDSWPDGSRYQEYPVVSHDGNIPKRIPSHDCGMVGFVKSLVDLTHETAIKRNAQDAPTRKSRIEALEFGEGTVFALKAAR